MKRVVITGLGIVSCIGNDAETVTNNLKNLNSGISSAPEYKEFSFSVISGKLLITSKFVWEGAQFWHLEVIKISPCEISFNENYIDRSRVF